VVAITYPHQQQWFYNASALTTPGKQTRG